MYRKPVVYIASPYTKGDPAINTRFQCETFDRLLTDGLVTPIAPLWSHLQHLLFPRKYEDWVQYDNEIILRCCDACLRLTATGTYANGDEYRQHDSNGADTEVTLFRAFGKPVFFSVEELYAWTSGNYTEDVKRLKEAANA